MLKWLLVASSSGKFSAELPEVLARTGSGKLELVSAAEGVCRHPKGQVEGRSSGKRELVSAAEGCGHPKGQVEGRSPRRGESRFASR